jgi:hypothetical protein
VPVDVPPNTKLALSGIGYVIVDERIVPARGGRTRVNGPHVKVTTVDVPKLPVGSEIIVAHAEAAASAFQPPTPFAGRPFVPRHPRPDPPSRG